MPVDKIQGLIKEKKKHWYCLKPYEFHYRMKDGEVEKVSKRIPDVPDLRTFAEAHPVRQGVRDFGPATIQFFTTIFFEVIQ